MAVRRESVTTARYIRVREYGRLRSRHVIAGLNFEEMQRKGSICRMVINDVEDAFDVVLVQRANQQLEVHAGVSVGGVSIHRGEK